MIPKLISRGRSFKGAAAYLLHDKGRASTNERVEWTAPRNLAGDDPERAWRIMAATALAQNQLKQRAGVKNTGRKSSDAVLHLSLAWHPDEADGLDREAMLEAAEGALEALGAGDRQALIVCHNDEPHPHVHVLINRVSPEDGRMLSSSKEKLKLSEWAQSYEDSRGVEYCHKRRVNNAARKRGEYTRGEKDKARHVHDAEPAPRLKSDPHDPANEARREQARKDAELAALGREMAEHRHRARIDLEQQHHKKMQEIRQQTARAIQMAVGDLREKYRPAFEAQHRAAVAETRQFEKREKSLLGRVKNALRAIDLGRRVKREDAATKETGGVIKETFAVVTQEQARRQRIEKSIARQQRKLLADRRRKERQIAREHKVKLKTKERTARREFLVRSEELASQHRTEQAKLRMRWKRRNRERAEVWGRFPAAAQVREQQQQRQRRERPSQAFARAAKPSRSNTREKPGRGR